MTRQTGERIFPEEIEQPRLSTFFGYASAVTISNRLEKAGMNASAAVSSEA
jgi:hypothetical protein